MELLASQASRAFVPLDPRTKLALMFATCFTIFRVAPLPLEAGVIVVIALLFVNERRFGAALGIALVFAALVSFDWYLVPLLHGLFATVLLAVIRCVRLFMPLLLCGNLMMRSTTVSQFIAAMRKMHVPAKLVIPLSVVFRFIPTIKEEWDSIRAAMRFRGIEVSAVRVVRSPLQTLEYALVPLLMSTATIANELAAASLSRGLDSETRRSSLTEVRLSAADCLLLALCALFIVLSFAEPSIGRWLSLGQMG
ncbi:MAG: energy-coupling factor transporter transmembrane protein EcfT [Coriobacteriales bacterium]|jgi:energy-coupling factor transport system permease protein|nr:energy-coupling factor transporter transmembrane protein EcfT [Coriobacteriales bacterium]